MSVRRRKWRHSKRSAWSRPKRIFFICFWIILIWSGFMWVYLEHNLKPVIMHHAKIIIRQTATRSINTAITQQVSENSEFSKLVDWHTDTTGKVSGFNLNYMEHMRITAQTVRIVEDTLSQLRKEKQHVPLGQAFDSTLINAVGPTVPIQFEPVGAVKVDLNTRQKNAGINMLLVEVYIRVTVNMTVMIPLEAKMQTVTTELPITYMLVVGDVPNYMVQPNGIGK